jgi:hypothetical protein
MGLTGFRTDNPTIGIEDFPDQAGGTGWFEPSLFEKGVTLEVVSDGFRTGGTLKIFGWMVSNFQDAINQQRVKGEFVNHFGAGARAGAGLVPQWQD